MRSTCTYRRRRLRPRGRAVDRAPVRKRHHVRQLAPHIKMQWPQPEGWSHAPLRQNLAARLVRVYHIVMLGARGTNKISQTTSKKRSQALWPKTPFRVGRTVRLDMNPLTGSVGSVPHRRAWRKGVREKRYKMLMLRPRPSRIGASPRIGRASRSDINPLTGSACSLTNHRTQRNGECEQR